jgi:hypothetical protein
MDTVGSSISRGGRHVSGVSVAAKVSPMPISSGPAIQTMSPALTSSRGTRSSPRVPQRWTQRSGEVLAFSQAVRFGSFQCTAVRRKSAPFRMDPWRILPQPMRPM